jgi:phosphoribosylformimino-5-aminoimidazole carboxamide ribotide isomerase
MSLVIIPSIDLRGGRVVRLKQGDYSNQLNYDVDPIATARAFRAAGAQWMHIVDLDGAKEGHPVQTNLIGEVISASGLRVQVGGGVRTTEDVQRLIDLGASRVVMGTKAMEDWTWFELLVHTPAFHQRLTLAIDAKDGIVATRGWTESSGRQAADIARQVADWPLAALLYTDVAKDGMLQGPNFEHTDHLARSTRVPVIASGGVGSLAHIERLMQTAAWGVIVGRSLYEGAVDLKRAIEMGERRVPRTS